MRACHVWSWILNSLDTQNTCTVTAVVSQSHCCCKQRNSPGIFQAYYPGKRICVVYVWNTPDINLKWLGKNMSGIFLTYTWYGKWVDIFQVYFWIFQTYRPSGQIYGIFQEYVRISNFYGFQMHHVTDIVNHIPDIGINIGYYIGCPDISDMISRYQCQYRVPISGVPISGYDSHRYRSQYRTRYRVLFLVPTMRSLCKAVVSYRERKKWSTEKKKILMFFLFLPEQKDQSL